MKFSKEDIQFLKIMVVLILITVMVYGLWAVDIGASCMVVNAQNSLNLKVTNGWFIRDPAKQYHRGLFMSGISTLLISIIAIYEITRRDKR